MAYSQAKNRSKKDIGGSTTMGFVACVLFPGAHRQSFYSRIPTHIADAVIPWFCIKTNYVHLYNKFIARKTTDNGKTLEDVNYWSKCLLLMACNSRWINSLCLFGACADRGDVVTREYFPHYWLFVRRTIGQRCDPFTKGQLWGAMLFLWRIETNNDDFGNSQFSR